MLTKSDIQTLKQAGYQIEVSYTSTNHKVADVNLNSLIKAGDTGNVEFENDDVEDEYFDDDSENYSIWSKTDANGIQHCVADGILDYDGLEIAIRQILNDIKKEG